MPRQVPLNAVAQVTLDGSGNGTASVGPTAQGETWQAGFTVSVHASTNASEAQARLYCGGGTSPAYFIGATTWGSTGDSNTDAPTMHTGQLVTVVWTGGDPGAIAYLSVNGTRTI